MVITHQEAQSFRVQFGNTIIAYNPVSKDSKFKSGSFGADIVLVSSNHPDFNGVEQVSRGDKAPFVVTGPGEYEVEGVFIRGFLSKTSYGGKELINTIYLVSLENMNLCFLGALSSPQWLSDETKEALDGIDILFVPISTEGTLSPAEAYKLSVKLEPKIIIPMGYDGGVGSGHLKTFLKEGGGEDSAPVDKLTVKKKDLEGKGGDIVVLLGAN